MLACSLNASPERYRARLKEAIAKRRPRAAVLGIGEPAPSHQDSLGVAPYTTVGDRPFRPVRSG